MNEAKLSKENSSETKKVLYEYGAMSSMFSVEAENKLTAYVAMVMHYDRSAHLLVIYSPESSKGDTWADAFGKISSRLDDIFGGPGGFDKYCEDHISEIKVAYQSIKRLV